MTSLKTVPGFFSQLASDKAIVLAEKLSGSGVLPLNVDFDEHSGVSDFSAFASPLQLTKST
jgi:hypothetical protein